MKPIRELSFKRTTHKALPSMQRRHLVWLTALGLGWPMLAAADCVDMRKTTAGEKEFHGRAMAALIAALPPVPTGGVLQNKDHLSVLGQQQCMGPVGDFRLEATRYYELNYRKSIVSVAINVKKLPVAENVLPGDYGVFSGAYGSASPKNSAELKVNNVVWTVSGTDSPLRKALVDAIDRARLQALVGKTLPSEAESKAYAAKAVPANIANVPASASPAPAATGQSAGSVQPNATQPNNANAPAAPDAAGEPLKKAVEAGNLLRGLFGR